MSGKPSGTITTDRVDGRATVVWERGPANIFDIALLKDLVLALRSTAVQGAHVVVLRGKGKSWSGGLAVEDHLRPRVKDMFAAFHEALTTLWNLPVPTIAQVHGRCLGGGLELLMSCDLAIASENASFGQPEIRLGVFPPFGAATYPRLLGPRPAAELMFLGTPFDAHRAAQVGIVNRVVREEELDASVALTAQTFCGHRRETLRLLKRVMRSTEPSPWAHVASAERSYLTELANEEDGEEGLRAFLEKRAPVWKDG